jgi:hypothetical protein
MTDSLRNESNQTAAEQELCRAAMLIGEIGDGRATGARDSCAGNSDDDLLGAVDDLEHWIKEWRRSL